VGALLIYLQKCYKEVDYNFKSNKLFYFILFIYIIIPKNNLDGVGRACDIYGIGTVMYELLVGAPPHYCEDLE
jgi:hypothetical protein